mmetsp:Transcript_2490/g.5448  ORF Transcript_2490/g.5448 Transcript_2490/m.5448 type:complete len:528 (+) Transcript_2490:80-1663(+)
MLVARAHGDGPSLSKVRDLALPRVSVLDVLPDDDEEFEGPQAGADGYAKEVMRKSYGLGWRFKAFHENSVVAARRLCLWHPEATKATSTASAIISVDDDGVMHASTPRLEGHSHAAVNAEFLATCLRTRQELGREVFFSLDPVVSAGAEARFSLQRKRFEPAWLATTSVGELLFQADYHLKELTMGEAKQPVEGLQSCMDQLPPGSDWQWHGRVWFVVKHAEVIKHANGLIVPEVKLGVETREQKVLANGQLVDSEDPLDPSHPLSRYATAFTECFDLIAERRSVFFQLRELARASVMAKYLLSADVAIEDRWFDLPLQPVSQSSPEVVPQLWNIRAAPSQQVDSSDAARVHGIYGGVQFGLARFNLAAASSAKSQAAVGAPRSSLALGLQEPLLGLGKDQMSPILESLARGSMPEVFRVGMSTQVPSLPRAVEYALRIGEPLRFEDAMGVDMNLQNFSLEASTHQADAGLVQTKDLAELEARVYEKSRCDRLEEPGLTLNPDASYVHGLSLLVQREALAVRGYRAS